MMVAPPRTEFPPVSAELIEALNHDFPDRCPDPGMGINEIHQKIGEVRVVRFLRLQHERQARDGAAGSSELSDAHRRIALEHQVEELAAALILARPYVVAGQHRTVVDETAEKISGYLLKIDAALTNAGRKAP